MERLGDEECGYVLNVPTGDEQETVSGVKGADEQFGSTLLTPESGWLLGLVLGLLCAIMIGRRRKRVFLTAVSQRAEDCAT